MSFINQGFDSVKDMFDFSLTTGGNNGKKDDKNKKKQLNTIELDSDIFSNPLFKKAQGLKKVLFKYTNKTYLSKAEMKKDYGDDYESEIKI